MHFRRSIMAAALASIAIPSLSHAQFKRPSIGVFVGPNISSISNADQTVADASDTDLKTKHRIGLNAGLYINVPIYKRFSLQPEVHYTQNGVTIEGTGETVERVDFTLDYAEIPLLLRLDLGDRTSSLHPFVLAGGSKSIRVGCKLTLTVGSSSLPNNCGADNGSPDPFTKSDVSAIGGAGVELKKGRRSLSLQARYSTGTQSVLKANPNGASITAKNNAFEILFGIGM